MAFILAYYLSNCYIFYIIGNLTDYFEGIPKEDMVDIPDEIALAVIGLSFVIIFLLGLEIDSDNLRDTIIIIAQAA